VTLGNSVVKRRVACIIGRVQGAAVLEEQVDHGNGADGGGTVNRVLATLVTDTGRGWGFLLEKLARQV